ncbi:hypothetical protein M422DRAFT_182538, partial [Sphaerobolus stellatus SS14]
SRPWAPFQTRSDFEFIEEVVTECLRPKTIDKMLNGYHGRWAKNTSLTVRNHKDVTLSLAAARKFGIEFQDAKVSHEFQGHLHTFHFKFRDPWDWILDIITDTTLSEKIMWFPVQKFLNDGYRIIRLYDDLNSGNLWWDIQSSLPQEEGMPHCFLPLHLWLNKSNVSTTIKMHPIIIRPGFLPSAIRNGSGNGGGMLIVIWPYSEVEDDSARSVEIAQFKREVYHKIFDVTFRSLRKPSRHGEAVKCGDDIIHVLYPGFLIHSVDGEEACSTCGTRGAKANHPCPKCLAAKEALHLLSKEFMPRTQTDMVELYYSAKKCSSRTAREQLLRSSGLHYVKNSFWRLSNSDPYMAYSYDILHALDSGEWGKHQWPLLLKILTPQERARLSKK